VLTNDDSLVASLDELEGRREIDFRNDGADDDFKRSRTGIGCMH